MSLNDHEKTSSSRPGSVKTLADSDGHEKSNQISLEAQDTKLNSEDTAFPEGGLRAWLVVAATSCILFCTFGYANAFGYDFSSNFYIYTI